MKIKTLLLPIIALAIMVALGACSNEELMTDANPGASPQTGRTLSFTAAMPSEDVATRVGLTQEDDLSITLSLGRQTMSCNLPLCKATLKQRI